MSISTSSFSHCWSPRHRSRQACRSQPPSCGCSLAQSRRQRRGGGICPQPACAGRWPATRLRDSSLSIATVNRQVGALLEAGLLRERADLSASGAIGRPRVPVEVNHEPFMTLRNSHRCPHHQHRRNGSARADVGCRGIPTAPGRPEVALTGIAETAKRYLRRWHRRRALWVGLLSAGSSTALPGR